MGRWLSAIGFGAEDLRYFLHINRFRRRHFHQTPFFSSEKNIKT